MVHLEAQEGVKMFEKNHKLTFFWMFVNKKRTQKNDS